MASPPKRPTPKKGPAAAAGGKKAVERRKVQRTTYDDKGMEITEWVYEDVEVEEGAAAAAAAPESATQQQPQQAGASTSGDLEGEGRLLPGCTLLHAGATKPPSAAGAGKKAGKSAPPAGQRSVASMFAKKN